jgi:hypothetical protein
VETKSTQVGQTSSVGQADRTDRIRSFVLRAGRLTSGQQRALDDLGPQFLAPFEKQPFGWETTFTPTLADLEGDHPGYAERKFENRGIRLGHGVWDLVYRKR